LATLAEPAITLFIGGIVALMVVAVFLPLINLAASLSM
jgi:type II secretory pathway component PulF